MLDIKFIRANLDAVKLNAKRRGSKVDLDELVRLDDQRIARQQRVEALKAERNQGSKAKPSPEELAKLRERSDQIKALDEELRQVEAKLQELLDWLPNMLSPDVPSGPDDSGNVEIKQWGEIREFDFQPKDHYELGVALDLLDVERADKVAGSRFCYWKNDAVLLKFALMQYTLEFLIGKGYTPYLTPLLARQRTLYGTGYLPFFKDDIWKLEGEDLALIGTSEQTLVGYYQGEVLELAQLPIRMAGYSECFRTEAGSYGKDQRGVFRVHQFGKVEQIVFCKPEDSPKMQEECLVNEEALLQGLGLPYHVVLVCDGDFGAPGYKKYDIEGWFPSQGRYRELTSNTDLTSFQTRRLNIRFRDEQGKLQYPHTISATGLTDRALLCILENYQQADGSVMIPEVLRKWVAKERLER